MSDDLERALEPTPEGDEPGTAMERAVDASPARVPVEGGRVARRQAELAERSAGKKAKTPSSATANPKPRPRVSVVGVLGELLITAGVVVLLFLGWQIWINDLIVGDQQKTEATQLSQSWNKGEATAAAPAERPDPGAPVVATAPGNAERFATLIVPRFGADYTRPIAEGVGVHDVLAYGIGHYPGTAMPGDVGNFAVAGHRTGWGAPLADIVNLRVGDHIFIETEDGWYQYSYRSMEYVMPTGVEVLEPVPQLSGIAATDRLITITSCNPPLTAAERVAAYGVYDTWYPRAGGPPAEIAALVQAAAAAG